MVLTTRLYCFGIAGEIFMLNNPYRTQYLNFVVETENLQIKTQKTKTNDYGLSRQAQQRN